MASLYADVCGIVVTVRLTSGVYRMVRRMFNSRGGVVIEIYWHHTFIYGMSEMFKVSSFCIDTLYRFRRLTHTQEKNTSFC